MDYRRRTKQKITASKSSNRIHWEMIRESIDVGSLFSCVIFVHFTYIDEYVAATVKYSWDK